MARSPGVFGPGVAAAETATEQTRVLARTGRTAWPMAASGRDLCRPAHPDD